MRRGGERETRSDSERVGWNESGREVIRELGRIFYKETFIRRGRERYSFSVHERIKGNETDGETEGVRGSANKESRDGGREAEIVSL